MPTLLLRRSGRGWSRLSAALAAAVRAVSRRAAARPWPAKPAAGPAGALLRTPAGRIPRVRMRARSEPADGQTAGARGAPPAYVERDVGPLLHEALARAGFVLVVGEPAAGLTRLAHEAVRTLHPRHAFVRPLTRAALPEAVRLAARRRRAVLWLDDLAEHLGPDGLTTARLDALRRTVVVATMRTEEYERYRARETSRLIGSDGDAWRDQRELLRRAVVVRLDRRWTPAERSRAEARRHDPRIAAALGAGERFGIAEVLAGAPGLPARWEEGWAAGARPRGAAVVAAALDCHRAGLRRPVDVDWLRALHRPYLAARGGDALCPESFAEALEWACRADGATGSLLTGSGARGYTACGYLLAAAGPGPVPDHLWRALLARAGAEDAYDLGLTAHQEGRLGHAVLAYTRALGAGVAAAELPLALAVGDAGRPRRAAADLAGIVRRRERRLGTRHPGTLAARHQLAHFTGEAGNARAAAARFAVLVADARAALGPGHPDTLAARHELAYFTGAAGDPRSAVRQLEALLADRLDILGPDHAATLAARRGLIWFRAAYAAPAGAAAGAVREAGAERQLAELLADARRVLGPRDPHTLAVRATQAALAARAGRCAEAVRSWADLAADRTAVLGGQHPHVVHARLEWARALIADGHPEEARELLVGILATAGRSLEPGHRHLRLARELGAAVTAAEPGPP